MYFSRIALLSEAAGMALVRKMCRNRYQLHGMLWELFEGKSKKISDRDGKEIADFIFRVDEVEGLPVIHLVSQRIPQNSDGIWDIRTKQYTPRVTKGSKARFLLRANPVVAKYEPKPYDGTHHTQSKRHDVVMAAKTHWKEIEPNTEKHPTKQQLVQEKCPEWLTRKAPRHGFVVNTEELSADSYRQNRLYRGTGEDDPIQFSSVDFSGILEVVDEEKFSRTLLKGFGRAKAFGCGLLLIKPAT